MYPAPGRASRGGVQPISRTTKLADLANGFANNGYRRARMRLDQAAARNPCEQAWLTTTD